MGPKVGLDGLENEKVPLPAGIRTPYRLVCSPGTTIITTSRFLSL
jgi:hypothetical protein